MQRNRLLAFCAFLACSCCAPSPENLVSLMKREQWGKALLQIQEREQHASLSPSEDVELARMKAVCLAHTERGLAAKELALSLAAGAHLSADEYIHIADVLLEESFEQESLDLLTAGHRFYPERQPSFSERISAGKIPKPKRVRKLTTTRYWAIDGSAIE